MSACLSARDNRRMEPTESVGPIPPLTRSNERSYVFSLSHCQSCCHNSLQTPIHYPFRMGMTMVRMMTASPLPFLLIFSLLSPSSSLAFSPTTSYFLAAGSSRPVALENDNPSRLFLSDSPYLASSTSSVSVSNPNSSATTPPLYASARLFTSPASYQFKTASRGTFILRLHFFPFSTPSYNLSAASFSVSALGRFALLTHFSAATSGNATIKEYYLSVDVDQFALTFTPSTDSPAAAAFVNAIELFTAPPNLIDGASPIYVASPANSGKSIAQVPNQGMETLHRVNVGGPLVTPANDTLWRTWATDNPFVFQRQATLENSTDATSIKYQTITHDPRRTPEIAPVSVYDTARTMAMTPTPTLAFNFNVTWSFVVQPFETYFIRMHFCNFLFDPVNFYFDVYIGQLSAYPDLNPGLQTDLIPAAVFYMDFAADSDASGLINVSIGRSMKSSTANAFLNGLEIMKLGLDSVDAVNHKNRVSMKILIPSIMGGLALLLILVLAAGVFVCRRRRQKTAAQPTASPAAAWSFFRTFPPDSYQSTTSRSNPTTASPKVNFDLQIAFEEILLATDGFDDNLLIGSGGFGKVYKGVFRDGTKVAVKRGVPGSKQGYPEFQREIEILSRIRHRHLVSLIGYCDDQSEMILVYEYMEKGPLRNYLYGSDNLPSLTWKQRLEICIGAARGLHYLHTGCSHNIIHRDIKSTNILLGEDYLAKVADFGLSRLGPSFGETHVSTGVKGTFGYLDPEYFKIQKLTDKSDIYSFGVMLFEVLCARPVIDPYQPREQLNLAECAVVWQRRGQLEKIIDPRLAGNINMNSLRKFGETAAKCLADYGVDRPVIGDVLWNLEYALQLQETEVRREPFDGSASVESQVSINMMRRVPSAAGTDGDNEDGEENMLMMREGQSRVTASTVFSQLFAGDGR